MWEPYPGMEKIHLLLEEIQTCKNIFAFSYIKIDLYFIFYEFALKETNNLFNPSFNVYEYLYCESK